MDIEELYKKFNTSSKLTVDEYNAKCIYGKKGYLGDRSKIYTDGTYWYLFLQSARWKKVKKELSFMEVQIDGDDEGVLRLDRYPNSKEIKLVKERMGLFKKRTLSPERKAEAVARLALYRFKTKPEGVKSDLGAI